MEEIIVNLHMHTRYSDGGGNHQDIAATALKCGLDAVIVTDHNVLVKDFEGYVASGRKKVLMLIGEEIHDQARNPQKNHLLAFGINQELATYANDPQTLINAVKFRVDDGFEFAETVPQFNAAVIFDTPILP